MPAIMMRAGTKRKKREGNENEKQVLGIEDLKKKKKKNNKKKKKRKRKKRYLPLFSSKSKRNFEIVRVCGLLAHCS
jgi:hypothetical protein